MNKKYFAFLLAAVLLIGCMAVSAAAADGVATFSALQTAVAAYSEATGVIQLTADIDGEETLSITKDIYLDLNGFDITCPVEVTNGTLYCMDSQTDDYTVNDAFGYGVLSNVSGNVEGAPATATAHGYLMVKEGTSLSFHCVNLKIHTMTLRPENVGLYYKCAFAGDELVAENVASYGVALSIKAIPDAQNLDTQCKYSTFTDFKAGYNESDSTSTLLKNVMKTTNPQLINNRNSIMPVFGRAYILTKGGKYVFGHAVNRTLEDQVKISASDTYWTPLSAAKKDAIVSMYRNYSPVMKQWNIPNVESRLCLNQSDPLSSSKEGSLKVLAITSSFGLNTTQLLYDVAVAEGYAPENVTVARLYTSGCTLEKHIKNAPSTPVYQYTKVSGDPEIVSEYNGTIGKMTTLMAEGEATLLDGLLDEQWDIIFMQQGAAQAPQLDTYLDSNGQNRIDILRGIMQSYVAEHCPNARFVWNMLWGYQSNSTISPFPTLFNSNQMYMYQCNIDAVMKYVVPRTDYDRIIPTGTVIQNARSSEFGDNLCRDTYHLNNYGGIMAAYGLFAVITGQEITEINIDAVAASATNGIGGAAKITNALTEKQKAIMIEAVNSALRNPFGVTESSYPPVDYSSYTYTENLRFVGNSKLAVCPACRAEVTWTEVTQENHESLGFGTQMDAAHYHFYLSEDVQYTGSTNAFIYSTGSGRTFCLHLNGNNLTATNNAISVTASNTTVNIMGTGTVSGNHVSSSKFRGSAFVLNAGTTTNPGTLRLYSGTYVQPEGNDQLAPVSTSFQGGLLEIYEDVTIFGNTNSVCLNTANNNTGLTSLYTETVNIYGGTFHKPVYAKAFSTSGKNTTLNILGGNFKDGIEIVSGATVTLSGAPVISGAGLKLADGITVTLDALTTGASIAVDADGAFTAANTNAANYLPYFSSVNGSTITESGNILYCKTPSVYVKNLTFEADGTTATCPACNDSFEWIEINQDNLSELVSDGYLGASIPTGTYHFYLSSDIEFTAANSANSFLHAPGSSRNICLHLNGNDLTATNCAISIMAGNAKLNVMGTGTVSGNHVNTSEFRGSAFVLNAGTTTNPGTLRLYSGTYVQPEGNDQLAPVSTSFQGGLLEIYEDVTIFGNTNSVCLNTANNNTGLTSLYTETVNIYGGTFHKPVYAKEFSTSGKNTTLNILGGNFKDGIEIVSGATVTLSGAPVISGAGLKLADGITVTLDALSTGASIAVDANGAFTIANDLAADYVKYFTAVKNGFVITEQDLVLYCSAS